MPCPNVEVSGREYLPPRSGIRPPTHKETMIRFYANLHQFYAGIHLHARSMHVCVLDAAGTVVYDRNLACHFPREGKGRGTFFFVAFRGPPRGHEVLARTGRMSILNVPVPFCFLATPFVL